VSVGGAVGSDDDAVETEEDQPHRAVFSGPPWPELARMSFVATVVVSLKAVPVKLNPSGFAARGSMTMWVLESSAWRDTGGFVETGLYH